MKTLHTHILGFPRIGARRELKTALDAFWRGDTGEARLEAAGAALRARHWALQAEAGLELVTVGDFAFYDQMANHIQLFGCEPARFGVDAGAGALSRHVALARGVHASHPQQAGGHALEMRQWFDTNYHYLVPEFGPETAFTLAAERLLAEVAQAQALGHRVKASLIGPLTFLWLGSAREASFHRLDLLDKLLPVYTALLMRLKEQGVEWVQVDEPILGLDLPQEWRNAFEIAYWLLAQSGARIMLATYFSPLEENLGLACRLPVAGLHVDGVRAAHELTSVCDWLALPKVLSVGIVDGRNIWRTDLDAAIARLAPLLERRGALWLAPSCSLLHVPLSLADESALDPELRSWLAFATEKLAELATLKAAMTGGAAPLLAEARAALASRARSTRVHSEAVAARLRALPDDAGRRALPSAARQEVIGLGVPVHGETDREDMVDHVAGQLDGFVLTQHGWVQSSGAHCVKPPLLYGDVARARAMARPPGAHAQSLAAPARKGMLTGPVTMLQWSFVRDDQPRARSALQIALAMRDDAAHLQEAGIGISEIDEPALREGLPLRRAPGDAYLAWATRALRIAAGAARDESPARPAVPACPPLCQV